MKKFFGSVDSWGPFFLRLALGGVMLPHGLQKLFPVFGGYGFQKTLEFMTQGGIPMPLALLVIAGESLGSVALILGFMTRFCAASQAVIMMGAISAHYQNGYFMNWMGTQKGEGFEFHLLMIGLGLGLTFLGAGKLSVDGWIAKRLK